jgi:hypothetical protein
VRDPDLCAKTKQAERGKNMGKGKKDQIAFDALITILALAVLTFITRLWPLLLLIILGIFIAALRLLFRALRNRKAPQPAEPVYNPEPPRRPSSERDVDALAFGVLVRRVTEQVVERYPDARWVWSESNAMDRFGQGLPLTIMLNRAGGFRKATILTQHLRFMSLCFETVNPDAPDEPPLEPDKENDPDSDGTPGSENSVDYSLIAFEWVEARLLELNNRCNDAIAEGMTTLLIPACDLPHPDSWPEVCAELTRNGFDGAYVREDGVEVTLPEQ